MAHVRAQIRAAVAAAVTGLPSTADRVYVGRSTRPLGADHPPSLLIYARSEQSRRDTHGPNPILAREALVIVEGRVSEASAAAAEEALDEIAAEVESALALNALGGEVYGVDLLSTEIAVTAEGESHIGAIALTWRYRYRTPERQPDAVA